MRTLMVLAEEEEMHSPEAAALILPDVYMYDILTIAATLRQPKILQN